MEIAAPELEGRTQCLKLGRIQLMLEIAVVPVETAAAGGGSAWVAEEVEAAVHLALQNLQATMEVEVAKSQPSSQRVSFRTFLQDLQYFD